MAPRGQKGEPRVLDVSKAQSFMDKDGNLKARAPAGDDFGKGFRQWSSTIESNGKNENNPNSFLSRGTILSYLEKKKQAEQKTKGGKNGHSHSHSHRHSPDGQPSKGDMDSSHTGARRTRKAPQRVQSIDGSVSHHGSTTGGHLRRNKTDDQSLFSDSSRLQAQEEPKAPRKLRGHETLRPPPNKYDKKIYRIGTVPHQDADGIMAERP